MPLVTYLASRIGTTEVNCMHRVNRITGKVIFRSKFKFALNRFIIKCRAVI